MIDPKKFEEYVKALREAQQIEHNEEDEELDKDWSHEWFEDKDRDAENED